MELFLHAIVYSYIGCSLVHSFIHSYIVHRKDKVFALGSRELNKDCSHEFASPVGVFNTVFFEKDTLDFAIAHIADKVCESCSVLCCDCTPGIRLNGSPIFSI